MEKNNKQCTSSKENTERKVTIKKETQNDDIKEFAETAMNELLGWYGYSSNNSREVRGCSTSLCGSSSSGPESPKHNDGCGWCGKPINTTSIMSSAVATFCSELCFSQSRRANFKKNKTCDWCRHVRHTVTYVDSQDGASQLQFCSDKCLNQYKMHIFWRETRAHLDIHQHLSVKESSSSGTLITPDLWLNKCTSPKDGQTTPSPPLSPALPNPSPLPLISVAPPSKLMPPLDLQQTSKRTRNKIQQKKINKKKMLNLAGGKSERGALPEMPEDLRVRHAPKDRDETICQAPICQGNGIKPAEIAAKEARLPSISSESELALSRRFVSGLMPPATVMVPYPVLLPFPIPIPIPIPLPVPSSVYNRCGKAGEERFTDVSTQTDGDACDLEAESIRRNEDEDQGTSDNGGGKINGRLLRKRKKIAKAKFSKKRLTSN